MGKPLKHSRKPKNKKARISYQDALLIIRNRIELEDYRYHECREAIADHRREMDREFEYETDRTWNG